MQFEIRKKDPPRVAKFQAIIVLTNVPCSSMFYAWGSAADIWWQPKQPSRKRGKAEVEKEENTSERHAPQKKTIRQLLLDQNCGKNRFPELTIFFPNA